MPWFRFIEECRATIHFRNGRVKLDFANLQNSQEDDGLGADGAGVWAWVAHREHDRLSRVVLVRRGNMMALHNDLMLSGFEVVAGGPADKIMRAAVKLGLAEELPDDAHWRRQHILARGRLRGR